MRRGGVIKTKMTQNLSSENIIQIENFIRNNVEKKENLCISNSGLNNAFIYFEKIDKLPINSYYIFDSAAMGYTCYSIYKSTSGQIYIIVISIQNLTSYMTYQSFIENNFQQYSV